MAKLTVNFKTEWIPFDTDLSTCRCCKETIYSNMMVFCITPVLGIKQWVTDVSDIKVCRSCYDLIISE